MDIGKFCRDNDATISAMMDLFTKLRLEPENGEQVLLFLAGVSMGLRQAPIIEGDALKLLAIGWQIAAGTDPTTL